MTKAVRLFLAALFFTTGTALAQDWPKKPVRMIVANSAGSLSDIMARLVLSRVSENLGQAFVIENKPGAGGSIAAAEVAKATPDGYTLLYASDGQLTINPFIYSKLGYDPLRDFAPVSLICKITQALYVNSAAGAKTLDEFVKAARANPGKFTYASGGNGHATHLAMELFLWKANLQLVHVPYKGTGPAVQAAAAGEVNAVAISTSLAKPFVDQGRLVTLASIGAPSADVMPGVPALNKTFRDSEMVSWQAVLGPVKMPGEVVQTLNAAIAKAVVSREVGERLKDGGTHAMASSPAELMELIRTDHARNGELAKRMNLKVD
jgi:tripartite-type tricarboxylate transporter receptor subunit TctC